MFEKSLAVWSRLSLRERVTLPPSLQSAGIIGAYDHGWPNNLWVSILKVCELPITLGNGRNLIFSYMLKFIPPSYGVCQSDWESHLKDPE